MLVFSTVSKQIGEGAAVCHPFSAFTSQRICPPSETDCVWGLKSPERTLNRNSLSFGVISSASSGDLFFFFFFSHTNTIFPHHLDHMFDLPPCNFFHLLKTKIKLKDRCFATLEEIQQWHDSKKTQKK